MLHTAIEDDKTHRQIDNTNEDKRNNNEIDRQKEEKTVIRGPPPSVKSKKHTYIHNIYKHKQTENVTKSSSVIRQKIIVIWCLY